MNDKTVRPEVGQHYEHKRGSIYTIEYLNEDIVVLYDGQNHRLENREYFVEEVSSGMYVLLPDVDIIHSDEEVPFAEIDGVGETTLESLEKEGIETVEHITYASDQMLLDLDGMGQVTIDNIRDWVDEHE